jgi:thiol reductant ABC exporter CydC subunit
VTATLGAADPTWADDDGDGDPGSLAPIPATLALARPALGRLLVAALLGAAATTATVALLATAAWLLSRAAQHPSESALGLAIVAVQFFGLSRGFARYYERLVGHDAAFRLLAAVRVRFYDHVASLAPAGLVAFSHGELVARMVADVDGLQELLLRVIPPAVAAALAGAVVVGGLTAVLPAAGVVTLVALGLAALVVPWCTSVLARRARAHEADARAALGATVVDLVDGAAELAVLGGTRDALARMAALDATLREATARAAWLSGLGLALTTALTGLAAAGNLYVGVAALRAGHLSGVWLGTLAVVPLAAFELVAPLPLAALSLTRARRAAARVRGVLAVDPPVADPAAPAPVPAPPHRVTATALHARYPGAREDVLHGVDVALAPGRTVAVVGRSGAGKSTLAALLVDFLRATRGSVTLDALDYRELAGDDVRAAVGLLDQPPHLFDTTIGANLRVARPEATDAELDDVLAAVGLAAAVAALPDGTETRVGRLGARLSGGQRQRLCAARALLARFPVLVLDEPVEHLEPAAADALLDALLDADPTRATLVVTHRLARLDRVDEVLVVDDGHVAERGTHAELVAAGGRYAAWWREERAVDAMDGR